MDLALLVYGISLLGGIKSFLVFLACLTGAILIGTGIYTSTWYFDAYEYSWNTNKDGTIKERLVESREAMKKLFKVSIPLFAIFCFLPILIPSEKTAYTMVGAYAAQKVSENEKVQQMSGKVLTIIEQKLDSYIEEAEKKATEAVSKKEKK